MVVVANFDQHEVAERRHILQVNLVKKCCQLQITGGIQGRALLQELRVAQRRNGRRLRQRIDIERLPDAIQQIGNSRLCNPETDPQTGQAVRFRERARHQQIRISPDPFGRFVLQFRRQIFVVGFIQHHHHFRRHHFQERFDGCRRQESTGRIIRVGDIDQPGVGRDRARHCSQIVAVILGRHHDGARAHRLGRQRVDQKCILRIHYCLTRLHEGMRRQFQNIVAAVAERDPLLRHLIFCSDRRFQVETVGIRITADIGYRIEHCQAGRLRHAARIFIGSKFDNFGLVQTEFARDFGNRLAALVRGNRTHIIRTVLYRHLRLRS